MREDTKRRGVTPSDERIVREHCLSKGVEAPDLAAVKDFLQFLATRYRGKEHAYQTWNEPNMAVEWAMGPLWPNGPRDLVLVRCWQRIIGRIAGLTARGHRR